MKMNAWMRVGAIGFAASLFVAGCVVNSTTDNGDGGAGSPATGGSGGSTGGSGGSTGGTAGTSSGGTAGTSSGGSGGAITCNPGSATSNCDKCMQGPTCCNAWEACEANQYCPTEFTCIVNCIQGIVGDAGVATDSDKQTCAGKCVDQSSGSGTIQQQTSDLFACVNDLTPEAGPSCTQSCFGG